VQVWSRSSHVCGRRSDLRVITKVFVSRDLWPWPWPSAHPGCRLQPYVGTIMCKFVVLQGSSHVCGRSSDLRVKVYRRRTDGRRTPRNCISSWNELIKRLKPCVKLLIGNPMTELRTAWYFAAIEIINLLTNCNENESDPNHS